ncbi:hypothetical protein [Blattabacterium cuenoti]|uniref:hypothetical protein n=1 Tax=Blattabacterium cuenoti TaxID=1653831 RepID=UPI00163C3C70|nr:hypothetical protein [Blattabacterium cuenoti]
MFKNKYFLMSILFFIWISFFDRNSLLMHYKLIRNIEKINRDIKVVKERIFYKKLKKNK